jgi:predicted membrane-bound spermidine synthase
MGSKLRSIYFLLFALSGFSGLIYESIWTHYLKLFLGHAAYAQSLVLAIFMGGMAIGAWVCSTYSSRWKNPLVGYAITEGVIGLCALLFHIAFTLTIEQSHAAVIPHLGNPTAVYAFKWTLSALMILPQSILLGMTFPLMSSAILRLFPDSPGGSIAMLYFTNSIGATVGILVSGFMLIRLVGLPGTMAIAGLINITLAVTVWFLIRKSSSKPKTDNLHKPAKIKQRKGAKAPVKQGSQPGEGQEEVVIETASAPSGTTWYRLFLLASLATGTASFIYEIGWIRMLSLVLGSSTHAFELMLSAFIFGLAFGGLWIQRRIDRVAGPVRYLARVQLLMGLLALSTLLLYGNSFEVMQWIVKTLNKTDNGYALFNLSGSLLAMAIMMPTTFCAGMTLPLITFILIRGGHGERSIGAVYAANTTGAILGVFFAIHLGMPLLGLKGLITCGAGLDIALGAALLWSSASKCNNRRLPLLATATGCCAVAATLLFVRLDPYKMGSGVYREGALLSPLACTVMFHKDGKTATVSCILDHEGNMAICTNGKSDASIMMKPGGEATGDELTMILLGIIPMALTPHATTAASIGLGSGLTSQTLLSNPLIQSVDTVEIEKEMIEAARYFSPRNELVYTDPRSKIYNDDAKTFFSTYNRKYDLIVSEPSNPWVSGVAGLFSEEFYRLIRHHMNDDGLFVQWVQLYEINVDLVASVLKAVSANFSDFAVYAPNDADIMIVARKNGRLPGLDVNLLKTPAIAAALKRIHVEGVQDIELRRIGNKRFYANLLETFPVRSNSDYYPVLDQGAVRSRFLGETAQVLETVPYANLPTLEMLSGSAPRKEATNVTYSSNSDLSREAFTAMGLRDYFLSGSFDARYNVPDDLKQRAILLKQVCAGNAGGTMNDRLELEFNVSDHMEAYLTPSEMDAFWQKLATGPCNGLGSPVERQWLSLFRAVGMRDANKMLTGARALLTKGDGMSLVVRKFLLASAMLGALSQGDRAESNRLWSGYGAAMFGSDQSDLLFRLLAAESTAH